MTTLELWLATDEISESIHPCALEIRAREIKRQDGARIWVAYTVCTGSTGGIASMKSLKETNGKRVESFEGKGDLIEKINALIAKKKLAI